MNRESSWFSQIDSTVMSSALEKSALNCKEVQDFLEQNRKIENQFLFRKKLSSIPHSKEQQISEDNLVRQKGYQFANINPLVEFNMETIKKSHPAVDEKIIEYYCGTSSLQTPISDEKLKQWCYTTYEKIRDRRLPDSENQRISEILASAEGLELELSARFPGAKRFSISGVDSFLVLLEALLRYGDESHQIQEFILGMAHRGRLNTLMSIFGKSPEELYGCFTGIPLDPAISGDVKYHRGYRAKLTMPSGNTIVADLEYNPSHLEAVFPVTCGHIRARLDENHRSHPLLGVIVHGDSSISGQGVVMEGFNMSRTRGYSVGGVIHVILDNQVGFTTSESEDTRSTPLCSDIAKMFEIPVIHVNADDPKAVSDAALFALTWNQTHHQDCIIRLLGYRKYGHNESDEPAATQPLMYQKIREHRSVLDLWRESQNQSIEEINQIKDRVRKNLQESKKISIFPSENQESLYRGVENLVKSQHAPISEKTLQLLKEHVAHKVSATSLHPRVAKIYEDRMKMMNGESNLDWGCAEILALGSLVHEGIPIRFSGQDSRRGTFFQRHIGIVDQKTGHRELLFQELGEIDVIDSLLSEEAVVGFEYGYSKARPQSLTIWEAQFGDFVNGAQTMIDQFISAGEQKWGHFSGLVMLLPHGYDGDGPEHSSARIERFLQLAAEENFRICYPSTPAQYFHLLRMHAHLSVKKPLIIFTPKSLLRNPAAVSTLAEITSGRWRKVIPVIENTRSVVKTLIFCCGKISYEISNLLEKNQINSADIFKIEQIYPFPLEELQQILKEYQFVRNVVFVQEEPMNQGFWAWIAPRLQHILDPLISLHYVGRPEQAATATGWVKKHQEEVQLIHKTLMMRLKEGAS